MTIKIKEEETIENIDFSQYDYVVDAVDIVTAKIEIIKNECKYVSLHSFLFRTNVKKRRNSLEKVSWYYHYI